MTRSFTEEETMLAETALRFFGDRNLPKLRRGDADEFRQHSLDLWREIVDLGWSGLLVKEEYGGSDFGPVGMGLLMEAAGRSLAPTHFLCSSVMGARILQAEACHPLRAELLSSVVDGTSLLSWALEEGPHHLQGQMETVATQKGSQLVLNGAKRFLIDGDVAQLLIVVCRIREDTGREVPAIVLVPSDAPGVTRATSRLLDGSHVADVAFKSVACDLGWVLATAETATDLLEEALDCGRILLSAELLGTATSAFDQTVAYLKERRQFDAAIGSFQALQHRAARLFAKIELARSSVYAALMALEAGAPDIALLASLAKAQTGDAARLAASESIQMHGGIGMTAEHDIGLYFKRANVLYGLLGTPGFHRDRYALLSGF